MGVCSTKTVTQSNKIHGIKDGTEFDSKFSENLGIKNAKIPKFIRNNTDTPTNIIKEIIKPPSKDDAHKYCIILKNVFTKDECNELIKLSEKSKYGPAYVRTRNGGQMLSLEGRNNSRVMIDSTTIADYLFNRVKTHLPQNWPPKTYPYYKENDTTNIITFNERLRFLRYKNGEYFKLHKDGP